PTSTLFPYTTLFRSNVSVWAMPPAIQRTITVSAVGVIFSSFSARSWRGKPAASAESVAALAVFKKSRRDWRTGLLDVWISEFMRSEEHTSELQSLRQ